jgi:hypothetical protein
MVQRLTALTKPNDEAKSTPFPESNAFTFIATLFSRFDMVCHTKTFSEPNDEAKSTPFPESNASTFIETHFSRFDMVCHTKTFCDRIVESCISFIQAVTCASSSRFPRPFLAPSLGDFRRDTFAKPTPNSRSNTAIR